MFSGSEHSSTVHEVFGMLVFIKWLLVLLFMLVFLFSLYFFLNYVLLYSFYSLFSMAIVQIYSLPTVINFLLIFFSPSLMCRLMIIHYCKSVSELCQSFSLSWLHIFKKSFVFHLSLRTLFRSFTLYFKLNQA